MLICFMGESCTGKSSAAALLAPRLSAVVYSGKDYLRLAKTPEEAKAKFRNLLTDASSGSDNIIFVVSELEELELLPAGAKRIRFTAGLDDIRTRFAARMHGNLPPPVAAMLERKHGVFDTADADLHVDSSSLSAEEIADAIAAFLG